MSRPAITPALRVLARLDTSDPEACWLWPGSTNHGHGTISSPGRSPLQVHRVLYEHFVGPIPEGLHLDHECHNRDASCAGGDDCPHRRCCNPQHMAPRSPAENQRAADEPRLRGAFLERCSKGHPYDDENTGWMTRGARGGTSGRRAGKTKRYCKACNRENVAAQARKAAYA